ncbi:MAG: hypothetical protein J0H17_19085 [Rhizobiales bacterium]|nr:hypothetical protein [Hyphomicrobiales bacterium]
MPDAVIFDHDGRPFERRDIEGITGIGNTTKLEEANKIGCFGIGFKSVYVVAERPQVHCTIEERSIAFAIRDLVVPELIAAAHGPASTRFVLPLPAESAAATVAKVRSTLDQAGARSLLYLQHLRRLEWTDGSMQAYCMVENGGESIRTLRTTADGKPEQIDRFLLLSRPVRRDGAKSDLSVKIAMRLNLGGEIMPEPTPTRVSVFFETEEQTGLHMHVHGPFQLTDNRANIKRDNEWNEHIADELAALLAESLPGLRDRGMIKRSFLEVLPNGSDDLSEPWDRLRSGAIAAFREHPLVPAHFDGHVRAGDAARGPADIRDFLRDEGLAAFAGLPDRRWATGVLRNSRADAFLSSLEIAEWGGAELLAAFQRAFGPIYSYSSDAEVARKACAWFDALDDEAVQRLYLLVDAAIRTQKRSISLAHSAFVRLEDGRRTRPGDALLPPIGAPLDEEAAAHGLVLVRSALLRVGRGRGKDVEQFLRRVGVKEIGERDYLRAIIGANYVAGATPPTVERHMQHMRRFLRWHAEHGDVRMLEGIAFLRVEGAEGYHAASAVYLDQPFVTSGLGLIYDGKVKGRDRRPLWGGYGRLKREPLLALLKALRVEDKLFVHRTMIPYTHPHRHELIYGFGSARETSTCENIDYTIPQLPALLARSSPEISKQIWRAVAAVGSHVMRASYAPNQTHEPHRALSTLALGLRGAAWLRRMDRCASRALSPHPSWPPASQQRAMRSGCTRSASPRSTVAARKNITHDSARHRRSAFQRSSLTSWRRFPRKRSKNLATRCCDGSQAARSARPNFPNARRPTRSGAPSVWPNVRAPLRRRTMKSVNVASAQATRMRGSWGGLILSTIIRTTAARWSAKPAIRRCRSIFRTARPILRRRSCWLRRQPNSPKTTSRSVRHVARSGGMRVPRPTRKWLLLCDRQKRRRSR